MSTTTWKHTKNRYSDIVLDPSCLPDASEEFSDQLQLQMDAWAEDEDVNAAWLEIPSTKTHLIRDALRLGFALHHCTPDYVMLTLWMGDPDDVKIPLFGTHIVRVEALLLRNDPARPGVRQVLVVKEKYGSVHQGSDGYRDWKLLSGAVEPGEFLDQAVVREVREEVGLSVRFCTTIGFGNRVSNKFGRSEIFFCCHVELTDVQQWAGSSNLVLQESELLEATWMDVSRALVEWGDNYKLRGLERKCLISATRNRGLINFVSEDQRGPPHRLLGHFVGVPAHDPLLCRRNRGAPRNLAEKSGRPKFYRDNYNNNGLDDDAPETLVGSGGVHDWKGSGATADSPPDGWRQGARSGG